MKTKLLFSALAIVVLFYGVGWGNPLMPYEITHIRAYPPEIGITFNEVPIDLSGCIIHTTSGIATINQGVAVPDSIWPSYLVLDSSNTSGFVLNVERDSIRVGITGQYDYSISWGGYGFGSRPIRDHYISLKSYQYGNEDWAEIFTFDFTLRDNSHTEVMFNEINANNDWIDGSDFIELFNKSGSSVSLIGWQLICNTIYVFPLDAIIPAHGFYVIDKLSLPTGFGFGHNADNLYLITNDNRLVDQVGWSSDHGANVSFMRFPDGDADTSHLMNDFLGYDDSSSHTFENGFPTRGAANRYESPGFVVIGAKADSVGEGTVRIHWTNPVWDTEFQASVVVRTVGDYVTNPAEGEIVYEGTAQSFIDQMVPAYQMFYYTVFARSISGIYSIPTQESQASIMFHGVGIDDNKQIPEKYFSLACYPNPFNAQTIISFTLTCESKATIAVYDITGRLVDIVAERSFPSGRNSLVWDASKRPSGVYFCSIKVEDKTLTQKVVLLR
jgi:hypothetical protein